MEVWDAYNANENLAGCDLVRGKAIPKGLFRIVCQILVLHVDGSYLLMQRDFNKECYPGMFEATAGGSALKGETPIVAALRELKEETGITSAELTQINKTLSDNTIFYQYLCVTNCEKTSITLQEGETISYRWISKDDFLIFMNTSECIPTQRDRLVSYLENIS